MLSVHNKSLVFYALCTLTIICRGGVSFCVCKKESCKAGFFACGGSRKRHTTSPPQCDNIFYVIGDSYGIPYYIKNPAETRFPVSLPDSYLSRYAFWHADERITPLSSSERTDRPGSSDTRISPSRSPQPQQTASQLFPD